jgi:hypothetical protein
VGSTARDSHGNPVQISFTITGPPTTYSICLSITAAPSYNGKAATYSTYTYSSYAPCRTFSIPSNHSKRHPTITGSSTVAFGSYFTFGGPATYAVTWSVDGTAVGSIGSFKWANSGGTYSPCPPDPQLQIGLWRPSRHQILNRCRTFTGSVTQAPGSPNSLDKDRGWKVSGLAHESMLRDELYLPRPGYGTTVTVTGIYVCDLYHGRYEIHPIFQLTYGGATYLSGPQYSTVTPSVSGTWTLKSCA